MPGLQHSVAVADDGPIAVGSRTRLRQPQRYVESEAASIKAAAEAPGS